MVARSPFGQGAAWPVVETVQRDGICVEVLAPAPGLDRRAGRRRRSSWRCGWPPSSASSACSRSSCSRTIDGRLLVNELAMRPHNSAHWTIEGARTSQFEQHLRAVLDYPLGSTELTAPAVVMVNLLGARRRRRARRHRRAGPPLHGPLARREAAPVRQGVRGPAARSATSPRSAPIWRPTRERARAAADYLMNGDAA